MPSLTEIFNASLAALGENSITDAATDPAPRADIARRRWPFTLDAVLRSHPWNAAQELRVLAADVAVPEWKYERQFTLPTDPYCLRVLEVDGCSDWQVFGRKIMTNEGPSLNIRYVGRITDYNRLDGALLDSLVDALASELAFSQIGSPQIAQQRAQTFELKSSWARCIDGQEGHPRRLSSRALVAVRGPYGGSAGEIEWMNR